MLAGNVGRIGGGIALMPDARIDDGYLDTLTLSPHGVVGWTAVAGRVLTRRRTGHRLVEHRRCRRLRVTVEDPQPVQVDGDVVAEVRSLEIHLDRLALTVRLPEEATLPTPPVLAVDPGLAAGPGSSPARVESGFDAKPGFDGRDSGVRWCRSGGASIQACAAVKSASECAGASARAGRRAVDVARRDGPRVGPEEGHPGAGPVQPHQRLADPGLRDVAVAVDREAVLPERVARSAATPAGSG